MLLSSVGQRSSSRVMATRPWAANTCWPLLALAVRWRRSQSERSLRRFVHTQSKVSYERPCSWVARPSRWPRRFVRRASQTSSAGRRSFTIGQQPSSLRPLLCVLLLVGRRSRHLTRPRRLWNRSPSQATSILACRRSCKSTSCSSIRRIPIAFTRERPASTRSFGAGSRYLLLFHGAAGWPQEHPSSSTSGRRFSP